MSCAPGPLAWAAGGLQCKSVNAHLGPCVGSWWLAVESVASAPGSLCGQLVASCDFQKDQKNYLYVPNSDLGHCGGRCCVASKLFVAL